MPCQAYSCGGNCKTCVAQHLRTVAGMKMKLKKPMDSREGQMIVEENGLFDMNPFKLFGSMMDYSGFLK